MEDTNELRHTVTILRRQQIKIGMRTTTARVLGEERYEEREEREISKIPIFVGFI